ncbi:MAG: PEGA domain-containing protein, partial [Gammaproteobacteria bacterium]
PLAIAPTSHLQVMSNIVGASVYVNGINKGIISNSRALYIQNLTEDEVEVRLEQAGYSPQTQKVVLKKGEWQQAYFEFVPENNLATVKTTPVSPALPDTPLSIKKEKEVIPITQGNEYSDRSERKNEISDLFNRKPPGIESTEILPLGRFGADNNASRSQNPDKNIPETDIFKQP